MKKQNRLFVLLSFVVLISGVLVVTTACGSQSPAYPSEGPSYLAGGDAAFPGSQEAMLAEADVIAVVRPTGESREVWNELGTFVSSRFVVEVRTVLKGPVETGAQFEVYAPGGHVKEPFEATGSRRPSGSQANKLEQFVDWPFFERNREELVFLKLVTPDPALEKPFYYNLGPSGRYRVENGRLQTIYPAGTEVDDPGEVRKSLVGKTLDELLKLIRASGR